MPNGLLLIDKPVGLRSAECVAHVKRVLGKNLDISMRVGHAGTLDSTASGLLLILLGTATRLSDYAMKLPKHYEAAVRLGVSTDTCDASGQVVFRKDASYVDPSLFDRALCSLWGTRMQRPPEISALKVNGTASHKTARAGQTSGLLPRPVAVTSAIRCSPLTGERARISVMCGKGTYIRALVRDIGEILGCGAHVEELCRLSLGPFHQGDACTPENVHPGRIRSLREIGTWFHRVVLTDEAEDRLLKGLRVPAAEAGRYLPGTVDLRHGLCVLGKKMIGFADVIEDVIEKENDKNAVNNAIENKNENKNGNGNKYENYSVFLKPRTNIVDPLDVPGGPDPHMNRGAA
ncbi:MAG: tRNA pseudouridine(55) synthase TruB [Synergistaceae bacterium]|jgi:tRNA pseudouridine(55) synthase|nr:tRNA pseudouridine(55) synthase TruB [Synergistaceae bacterium]